MVLAAKALRPGPATARSRRWLPRRRQTAWRELSCEPPFGALVGGRLYAVRLPGQRRAWRCRAWHSTEIGTPCHCSRPGSPLHTISITMHQRPTASGCCSGCPSARGLFDAEHRGQLDVRAAKMITARRSGVAAHVISLDSASNSNSPQDEFRVLTCEKGPHFIRDLVENMQQYRFRLLRRAVDFLYPPE